MRLDSLAVITCRCFRKIDILKLSVLVFLFFSYNIADASSPRIIKEAVQTFLDTASREMGIKDIHVEFLDATYAGANRRFDAQFRAQSKIIRARISGSGTMTFSSRAETNEQRIATWQEAKTVETLPDLDAMLTSAESLVRSEGYQPTGIALLKYNQKAGSSPDTPFTSQTRVFFDIANSDKARVVEFTNNDLTSHKEGVMLQVSLPVIRSPRLFPPDVAQSAVEIPNPQSPALQTFRTTSEESVLRLEGDFLFAFDNDKPRPEAEKLILQLAEYLRAEKPSHISIEGHTDSWGTPHYNDDLSLRRAQAIADRLQSAGVPREAMEVKGYGEARPIATETAKDGSDNPVGRQLNRRVEVIYR